MSAVHFMTRMARISSKVVVLSSTGRMEIHMLLVAKVFSATATPTFSTTITVSFIALFLSGQFINQAPVNKTIGIGFTVSSSRWQACGSTPPLHTDPPAFPMR